MSNLFLTLIIAFIIIIIAISCLAVGWLITGKTKIVAGCGRDPTKQRDDNCQTSGTCELCSTPPEEPKSNHRSIDSKSE